MFFFSSYHGLRHNQTNTQLMTVPTALERVGNFSQSLKPDENGRAIPVRIFDPFNVTQNADLYRRAEIPNAIITNPDPYALRMFSSIRCRTGRRTTSTTPTTSRTRTRRRCGGTARTTASTGSRGRIRSTAAAASPTPRSSRRVPSAPPRSTMRPAFAPTTTRSFRSATRSCSARRSSPTFATA